MTEAKNHPVSYDDVVAFATGESPGHQNPSIASHINGCAECMNTVEMFRTVQQAVIADAALTLSPSTLTRLKHIMPQRPTAPSLAQSVAGTLRRIMAELVFDGRQPVAAVGLRGGDEGFNLVYTAGDIDIDLRCEPTTASQDLWSITGQLSQAEPSHEGDVAFIGVVRQGEVQTVGIDNLGMFSLTVQTGDYEVSVRLPSEEIVLPTISVG